MYESCIMPDLVVVNYILFLHSTWFCTRWPFNKHIHRSSLIWLSFYNLSSKWKPSISEMENSGNSWLFLCLWGQAVLCFALLNLCLPTSMTAVHFIRMIPAPCSCWEIIADWEFMYMQVWTNNPFVTVLYLLLLALQISPLLITYFVLICLMKSTWEMNLQRLFLDAMAFSIQLGKRTHCHLSVI